MSLVKCQTHRINQQLLIVDYEKIISNKRRNIFSRSATTSNLIKSDILGCWEAISPNETEPSSGRNILASVAIKCFVN